MYSPWGHWYQHTWRQDIFALISSRVIPLWPPIGLDMRGSCEPILSSDLLKLFSYPDEISVHTTCKFFLTLPLPNLSFPCCKRCGANHVHHTWPGLYLENGSVWRLYHCCCSQQVCCCLGREEFRNCVINTYIPCPVQWAQSLCTNVWSSDQGQFVALCSKVKRPGGLWVNLTFLLLLLPSVWDDPAQPDLVLEGPPEVWLLSMRLTIGPEVGLLVTISF